MTMTIEGTIYALALAVGLWMAFGSLNELHNANSTGGCCKTQCGDGFFDKITWWVVLLLSISFTLIVLYSGFEEFVARGGGGAAAGLLAKAKAKVGM